jgi:hypothetical protein
MQILKDIGSYAGLGAVVGLAVLSALYFSQARDVKRLREWAGRAPERTAEGVSAQQLTPQRVTAVPQGKPAVAAGKTAVPKPAPAAAAAAGAGAAQARPAAATPAAQGKPAVAATAQAKPAHPADEEAQTTDEKAPVPAEAKEAGDDKEQVAAESKEPVADESKEPVGVEAKQPAGVAAAAAGAAAASAEAKTAQPTAGAGTAAPPKPGDGTPPTAPAKPATGTPPKQGDGPPVPSKPGASTPAAARPAQTQPPAVPRKIPPERPIPSFPSRSGDGPGASQTTIIPPYGQEEAQRKGRQLPSARYLALAAGGVLVIGGAAAFGLTELSKKEAPPPKTQPASKGDTPKKANKQRKLPPINASRVTVSVLNGTTVPGLAAQIGDRVGSLGFQLGNVTNSSDQQRAESVVLFAPGAQREAAFVGRKLGISQREPIDPQSQGLAGDARVVVITGSDKTQ